MLDSHFLWVEYPLLRVKTPMLLYYVLLNDFVAETKLHRWRLDIGQVAPPVASWFINPSN
jgi:hypothetical protein